LYPILLQKFPRTLKLQICDSIKIFYGISSYRIKHTSCLFQQLSEDTSELSDSKGRQGQNM